jgi:hypothetical protein
MHKHKDPNYVAKLEKAIAEKYGEITIKDPKSFWDDEKEQEHKRQIEKLKEKQDLLDELNQKVEVNGILIPKKLLIMEGENRTCPICDTYSFNMVDDVYMKKFKCCHQCYIQWVEGREERWAKGWRPNNGNDIRNS